MIFHNNVINAGHSRTDTMIRVLLLVLVMSGVAMAQTIPDLLLPSNKQAQKRPEGKREKKVKINPSAFKSARIQIELFEGKKTTFTRKHSDKENWVGDSRDGEAIISVVEGVVNGMVFTEDGAFEFLRDADGDYTLIEVDPTTFPPEGPPDMERVSPNAQPKPRSLADLPGPPVMDVVVFWTPQAESAAGGAINMRTLITNAIALSNKVYANSQVNTTLRLVHAARVEYKEVNISTDLSALRSTSDGKMDQIHAIRTTFGGDIVSLIGNTYKSAGYCGLGGLMRVNSSAYATQAFNAVDRRCAVANLSFPHELGHNQGLHHNKADAGSTGAYPYAYGYQDPAKLFRTVMSYGSATRRPYLSNPNVLYGGKPTGIKDAADNSRALQLTAPTVGAFRGTVVP